MKRLFSIIMLLLMITTISVAEEFTLRNGIIFGDSMDTVRQKETIAIDEEMSDAVELKTQNGVVAGFEDTTIYYTFDDNQLIDIWWRISMPSKDDMGSAYQMLKESLSEKYGKPLGNKDGVYHPVHGTATQFRNDPAGSELRALLGWKAGILEYDEWVYEYAEGKSMKIELVQDYLTMNGETDYTLFVSYTYFESDIIDAVQNSIMNDI